MKNLAFYFLSAYICNFICSLHAPPRQALTTWHPRVTAIHNQIFVSKQLISCECTVRSNVSYFVDKVLWGSTSATNRLSGTDITVVKWNWLSQYLSEMTVSAILSNTYPHAEKCFVSQHWMVPARFLWRNFGYKQHWDIQSANDPSSFSNRTFHLLAIIL